VIDGGVESRTVIVVLHLVVCPPAVTRSSTTHARWQVPVMSIMNVALTLVGSATKPLGHSSNQKNVSGSPSGSNDAEASSTTPVDGPVHSTR
jgi:hypothetical protein